MRSGTSQAQIDRLEKGTRRITPDWLERLAPALDCKPLEILGQQGGQRLTDQEQELLDLFRFLNREQQQAFIGTLRAFQPPKS